MSGETDDAIREPIRSLQIFRAAAAAPLAAETMGMTGVDADVQAGLTRLSQAGVTAGLGDRSLLLFSEPGETGFSLVHLWFKSGYVLLPHSHDCDCLYYVLAGRLRIGRDWLDKGDGLFVPSGQAYTYEAGEQGVEVLEFRNATRFSITLKGGRDGSWERLISVFRDRQEAWKNETMPPSERGENT